MKPIVFLKSGGAWAKEAVSVCHFHIFVMYKKLGSRQTFTSISYVSNSARCFTQYLTLFKSATQIQKMYNICRCRLISFQVNRTVINFKKLSVKKSKPKHHSKLHSNSEVPHDHFQSLSPKRTPKSSLFLKFI